MMKRTLSMAALLGTLAAGAWAAAADGAESEVLKREEARFTAMVKADVAGLEDVLADDLTYVHSNGNLDGKRDFIEAVRTGRSTYHSFDREGVAVRLYGDTAVVTGRGHVLVQAAGAELDLRLFFTDVYVRRGGKWRMVAWQSTRLPEK
jgi:hypothetical protein